MATKTIRILTGGGNDDDYDAWWSVPLSTANSLINSNNNIPSNAVISRVGLYCSADYDGGLGDNPYKAYLKFGFGTANSISTVLLGETRITKEPTLYPSKSGLDVTKYVNTTSPFGFKTSMGERLSFCVYTSSALISRQKMEYAEVIIDYTIPSYTLTVTAGTGGTVTGGGTYERGSTATLTATPNAGYSFVKWSDNENAPATRTVTVTGNATYTAVFSAIPDINYENLFSVSNWINSYSSSLTGGYTLELDNTNGNIKIIDQSGGSADTYTPYSGDGIYTIPVTKGADYVLKYTVETNGLGRPLVFATNDALNGYSSVLVNNDPGTSSGTHYFDFKPTTEHIHLRFGTNITDNTYAKFSNIQIYKKSREAEINNLSKSRELKTLTSLYTPTKKGHSFGGWYKNEALSGNALTLAEARAITTGITVYAKWNLGVYTITLNNQSATSAGTSTIYLKYSAGWYSNSAATTSISYITIPKKTGYTFGGYYTSTNGSGTQIINSSGAIVGSKTYIAENDTLYAYWTKNTYSIHFNSNGGTGSIQSQTNIAYDTSINLTLNNGSITKIGYNFSGWNTEADGSGTPYANGASVSKLAGSSKTGDSITLYAQWTVKTPLVTFDPNGGSVSPTSTSVTYGQSYGALPTPIKNHYNFNGWYYNGVKIISSTIVNKEDAHTLVASWTPKTYTLIYDARGGMVNPASKEVEYGSKYGELPTPQKVGHTFDGWWTAADGGDRVSSETIMTEDNQIIYAHWIVNKYTITFDGNGADNTGAMIAQQFSYGETKKLTKNVFTKEFHNFANWKDEVGKDYADEEEITYLIETDKTLTAQWEKGFLGQILIGDNSYQVIKILIDIDKVVDKVYLDKNLTFQEEK